MTSISAKITAAKKELTTLQEKVQSLQSTKKDKTMGQVVREKQIGLANIRGLPEIRCRRTLKGHFGKVTALHWSADSALLVSASQDGNLIVWNGLTNNKLEAITLKSSYVMAVGMEQTKGNMVACGGLDNLCTIYLRNSEKVMEMASHDGFLSCCRFLSEDEILTSSGDSTCIHWDIKNAKPISTFAEHTADAMFLSIKPDDRHAFVSCSVDKTVKLWDTRAAKSSKLTFRGHEGDINSVEFMPSEPNVFATCSEDGTARLFDIRAATELARFGTLDTALASDSMSSNESALTSLSFSRSGRLLFCGDAGGNILAYDCVSDKNTPAFTMQGAHEKHVACLGVSPNGDALCSGSWDATLKIWA